MTAPSARDWAAGMASQRKADQWFARSNPATFVGSKHHTVPAVILRRFAASGKRLSIWRWPDRQIRPGSVSDLAIKNFYTSLNTDGQFDGRVEEVLGQVETAAAPVIDWLLSPFRGRKLTPEWHADLCALFAFQLLRGPRKRKEIELSADYYWKVTREERLSRAELRDLTAVPHPNEHLQIMMKVAQPLAMALMPRQVTVIRLDQPLLVVSDEPVLVDVDNHVRHLPQCTMTAAQRRQHQDTDDDILHVWPTRPAGVEVADAIAMPVGPDAIIVLGPKDHSAPIFVRYDGDEAAALASEVNTALVSQAIEWVAARPDHPDFASWNFPDPGPLIGICDGGSIMSQDLKTPPVLKWQRIRKDW